jgi:hypothetical protein
MNLAQLLKRFTQGNQAWRVNPIVVCQKNQHGSKQSTENGNSFLFDLSERPVNYDSICICVLFVIRSSDRIAINRQGSAEMPARRFTDKFDAYISLSLTISATSLYDNQLD